MSEPAPSWRSTPTWCAGSWSDFLRTEITRAGFERAVVGLSGGVDSAAGLLPGGRSPRPGERPGRAHALPAPHPRTRSNTPPLVIARPACSELTVPITPMAEPILADVPEDQARPARQHPGAAAHDRALRPVGGLPRPGGRHRQQDRDPARLHHAVRRFGLRPQSARRSVQDTGPAAGAGDRRPGGHRRPSRRAPTCGPARRTRASWDSRTPRSISCCCFWSTAATRPRSASRPASSAPSSRRSSSASAATSSTRRCRPSPSSATARSATISSTCATGGRSASRARLRPATSPYALPHRPSPSPLPAPVDRPDDLGHRHAHAVGRRAVARARDQRAADRPGRRRAGQHPADPGPVAGRRRRRRFRQPAPVDVPDPDLPGASGRAAGLADADRRTSRCGRSTPSPPSAQAWPPSICRRGRRWSQPGRARGPAQRLQPELDRLPVRIDRRAGAGRAGDRPGRHRLRLLDQRPVVLAPCWRPWS